MTATNDRPRRIAVIGGGISGLAAAHRVVELAPDAETTLFERSTRLGGVLSTLHEDGYQIEESADNFITTVPWGLDLCKRMGLGDDLVQTNPAHRRTFVIRRGRLRPLPDGFLMMAPTRMWPMAVTPILSPMGKARAGLELFVPARRDDEDESMAAFVRRRLGREVFDRLVEPLISGVYAADMEKLSVMGTLPRFREMERNHGSLIRAMQKEKAARRKSDAQSGARYSMFVTLEGGLTSLVDALAAKLPEGAVRLGTPVERIEQAGGSTGQPVAEAASFQSAGADERESGAAGLWKVWLGPDAAETFDAVIVAAPSHVAGKLLEPIDADLATDLGAIHHEGTAILSVAYRREQIGHPLDGMGFVVPKIERSPILACSFSSRKYLHRAPEGKELFRVFVGGARAPEMAEVDDDALDRAVLPELAKLLSIQGDPIYRTAARWPGTMPQYHVGHRELVARIEACTAALPRLAVAGNSFHGVGIPNCIHSGEQAAEQVLAGSNE